jgi:hypothetical protein
MVKTRGGRSTLGCLFTLLLLTAAGYFAVKVGEPYLRFYRYQDAMRQEVRFANKFTDDAIRRRLSALADSLGLPEEAGHVTVRRKARTISVWSEYYERVEMPLFLREIYFNPSAEGDL